MDRIVCLGDVVGYGAFPNECIELIRERDILCLRGNHDREAISDELPLSFNEEARAAILWTRERLTDENREFLAGLEPTATLGKSILLCHGSPRSEDEYIFSSARAMAIINLLYAEYPEVRILFFGHTHLQSYISTAPKDKIGMLQGAIKLPRKALHLINPGSVGQPRDGYPAAAYLIYNSTLRSIEFRNVRYDVEAAARSIVEAGLPPSLAERLKLGI